MAYEDYVGKQLGNYQIVELVGKGGMAGVFRAHQPSMNRDVAVKIMSQALSEDEAFVARFKNEARLIAQLEHPHILPVHDFGEEQGLLYIVMRYLPAGDLEDRIPSRGMPVRKALPIIRQIASALDYAHSKGVIHRDLKPSNVMIDSQNNAFLTDFGIAKSMEGTQNLTGTGSIVGTPTYMSPEQGLGEEIDSRSDLYSLGVMVYEILIGDPPFIADNPMAVMLKHINDLPSNPSEINPAITPAVSAVILRSLAKERDARYQTAVEMAEALEAAASGRLAVPVETQPALSVDNVLQTTPVAPANAGDASTLAVPVPGAPEAATAEAQAIAPTVEPTVSAPAPEAAAPALPPGEVEIKLNQVSAWLNAHTAVGVWIQAVGLSLVTFLLLSRLTQGGLLEIALLSLVPGVLLYGLLNAPTLGALTGLALLFVPILLHTPGLAILWLALLIIAGARLNSREIMLVIVTIFAAGTPFGWLVPLLAPWWLRGRRVVLPAAVGVLFATVFAATLGWNNAMGLLPASGGEAAAAVFLGDVGFSHNFLGLFEPGAWSAWGDSAMLTQTITGTFDLLGAYFARTHGLPLIIATAWAVAATVTVSNRRVESMALRAGGIGLGLLVLLAAHLLPGRDGIPGPDTLAVVLGVLSAVIAVLLSQWPVQVDPNAGNKRGTVLRMLRQSLGAFYVALGVAFFAALLNESGYYLALWLVGSFGVLTMITNPMIGPPLVFAALVAAYSATDDMTLTIITALLLGAYLVVNLLFDRRRPRRWNPLGAGLILGAPGLAGLGILPLGSLSIGTLEAQVPAAIMAVLGHVLLLAASRPLPSPLAIIIQLIATVAGVLVVDRLMALDYLSGLGHKLRRLIFTVGMALILALSYYTIGQVAPGVNLLQALLASLVTAAALVAALGDRAMYWRRFIEREEEEEEILEDEEVTGPWSREGGRG